MKYKLSFSILYDEKNWKLETFEQQRRCFLEQLLESMGSEKGKYINSDLVFDDANVMLAKTLIQIAEKYEYNYDIFTSPVYSSEEIKNSRYVPFLINSDEVDFDKNGKELNLYPNILCVKCSMPDDAVVPSPYYIDKKEMKKLQDLYYCSNGVTVFSMKAFDLLVNEMRGYVNYGDVVVLDKGKKIDYGKGFMWVKPKYKIGPFVDAVVKQYCDACSNPVEVRQERSKKLFEMNVVAVDSFKDVQAPIVLVGNWYGEVGPKKHCDRSHYVFISGELHEKIIGMELKGFVRADRVIHAIDEEELLSL